MEFRIKVIETKKKEGLTLEEVARRFVIGKSTVVRWLKRIEVKTGNNRRPATIDMEKLKKDVEMNPDAYQYERAKYFKVSARAIGYALRRLKIVRKKKFCSSHLQAQQEFEEKIKRYKQKGKKIVYIDESGFPKNMPCQWGYVPIGKPCSGQSDWHARGYINAIGALLNFQLLTIALFKFSIDSEVFVSWGEEDLLPKLPPNCVLVMDNATIHKRSDIKDIILEKGHLIEFLPTYSPHLNPIEHFLAKALLRRLDCSVSKLFKKHL